MVREKYGEGRVAPDLYALVHPLIVNNAYVVHRGRAAYVVDPGLDGERVVGLLKANGLAPKAVFVTHGHYDHLAGAAFVQRAFGCPVYLHERDARLRESGANAPYFCDPPGMRVPPMAVTGFAKEGELPQDGFAPVGCLWTPGHTPGSVCYQIGPYVFSGDCVFDVDVGRTDFPYSDPKAMEKSLSRFVSRFGGKGLWLMPGHEEWARVDDLKAKNPYLGKRFR